jgi:hypothetical protein
VGLHGFLDNIFEFGLKDVVHVNTAAQFTLYDVVVPSAKYAILKASTVRECNSVSNT